MNQNNVRLLRMVASGFVGKMPAAIFHQCQAIVADAVRAWLYVTVFENHLKMSSLNFTPKMFIFIPLYSTYKIRHFCIIFHHRAKLYRDERRCCGSKDGKGMEV